MTSHTDSNNSKPGIQNLRVLLWDIDGTLMRSTHAGAFKEYFAPALERVFGSSGSLADLQVSGMTDTQIAYEALRGEGFSPEQIIGAKDKLLPIFKEEMEKIVGVDKHTYDLLPGAREILDATSKNSQFINATLTGNLSVAAEIKLKYFDLWKYFKNSPNIFGEISHDRRDLGKAAIVNFEKFVGVKLKPEQFIVVGDTPNDIAAARAFGAKMISVATGRNHPSKELATYNPDAILENLSDTKKVLQILETI